MTKPIGFDFLNGGANNQKLAVFGIVLRARELGRAVKLPRIVDFTPGSCGQRVLDFDAFFKVAEIAAFLEESGIELSHADDSEHCATAECFREGAGYLRRLGFRKVIEKDDLLARFVRHLELQEDLRTSAERIICAVKSEGIQLACQLRIENDWQAYAEETLAERIRGVEDYNLSFDGIFSKLDNTDGIGRESKLFACCDEENLPVDKREIIAYCEERYGKRLFFKSCLQELAAIGDTRTALSLIDFEVCLSLPYFVGLTRSTFSNLLCFTKLVTSREPWRHYIYNHPSDVLMPRRDGGCTISPADAISTEVCLR
jgi:hypothetical protein